MFMLGVALSAAASLVNALAPSIGVLIAGRLLQGLGPAIVAPTTLAIISATFPEPRERAGAISAWSAGSGRALALGPVVGGVLVDAFGGLGFFIGAPVSGRATGRLGPKAPMIGGLALCGAALGLLRLHPHSTIPGVWWDLLLVGLGAGVCLTPMTTTAVAAVAHHSAGMASAVHNSMRQFGQALGVAVLGAFVYADLPGGDTGGVRLDGGEGERFVTGLHSALLASGICLLLAAALAALMIPRGFLRPAAEGVSAETPWLDSDDRALSRCTARR